MPGMDVEPVDEIIAPVNEADHLARPLGDVEFKPASRDIVGGAIFARIGLRRSECDGRAPCRLERAVQDGDEGGAVVGARGAEMQVLRIGHGKMVGIAALNPPCDHFLKTAAKAPKRQNLKGHLLAR